MDNLSSAVNWIEIESTCPDFAPNIWDFLLALIALAGCVLNTILFIRFHKQRTQGTTFLGFLAGFDLIICSCFLWTFSFASLITYLHSDSLAQLRIETQTQMKPFLAFYETTLTFNLLFIIIERFLWTCTTRNRLKWKMFTDARPKFSLAIAAAVYALVTTIISCFPGVELSKVPFCDVAFRPIGYEIGSLRCLQLYLFPIILFLATVATFVFAMLTGFRLSKIGTRKEPVLQEEINLTGQENQPVHQEEREQKPRITIVQAKRSIICMLVVAVTFLIRAAAYYMFIDPYTSSMYTKSMGDRHAIIWWYDSISVVFSASRFFVYYLVCRNQIVAEYPLNELRH